MYAQELLVHDRSQWQRAKRFHACFVDLLAVLVLAFELEGEVVGEMAALVVAAKEPESAGIPYLQGPEV
jgi:hypothetical protein